MSDHNDLREKRAQGAIRSERIGQWEEEGGSLRPSAPLDAPDSLQASVGSAADTALLRALPLAILMTSEDGLITHSNLACQKLYATSATALKGQPWRRFIDTSDQSAMDDQWQRACAENKPLRFEARLITGAALSIWVRYSISPLSSDPAAVGYIHTIEDITVIKASEQVVRATREALSAERERARVTLECIGDAVISTDSSGRVTYLNAVAEELTGWTRESACGRAFSQVFRVVDSNTGKPVINPAESAMESLAIIQLPPNCLLLRPDGSELAIEDSAAPILNAQGELLGAVVIFRDQNMSREITSRMAHMARHDILTGLPNRFAFAEHFSQAINLARRHCTRVGLMFIDLDNFKWVNDTLGHKTGDRLLKKLSRRLIACVRSTDLVGRQGGDEFLVLLSEIKRPDDARKLATKMLAAAAVPTRVQGHVVRLQMSIGISLYPDNGTDSQMLMHRADVAMYHAKREGGGAYAFYHAGLESSTLPCSTQTLLELRQRTERGARHAEHSGKP